ncbi:MAGE-domain-containing protein, partial [Dendrothele bispora CBS 962.96]
MPRGATRSQKAPRPSQSQPRLSQSQRRVDSDDDEDMQEEGGDEGSGMDVDGEEESGGDAELKRKASALVRYALFCEHKRMPLRREEFQKKAMGSNSRSFFRVLEIAQGILRQTFGMELVELQSKAAFDKERAGIDEEQLEESRKATATKKKATTAGSKQYIMRSTLDPNIVEYACQTIPEILDQEHNGRDEEDENETLPQSYGSILSWSTADQLEPIGILYVILALILVSGRVISDTELRSHLKRLHLHSNADVNFDVKATLPNNSQSLDGFLESLRRQGYIEQQIVGEKKAKGAGKRIRSTQADNDTGIKYEWRWGVRAQSEIGEQGIAQFVAEFMVTREHEEDEDEEEGSGRNRRRQDPHKKVEKMLEGIGKAAGGELAGL